MKTKLLLSALLFLNFCILSSQIPQGFNYQAIARNASGNPIVNTAMPVIITIKSDSVGGTTFWIEKHSSVTTNSLGLFTLVLGQGARQTGSTVATFNDIDWSVTPKFINTQIDYNGLKDMGTTRLWSVPYSMVSGTLAGPIKKLAVTGETNVMDEALFEVKNKNNQTVFAVYNEGVRVYVDDGLTNTKGTKGGFAVGGFGTTKTASQEFFRVTRDSTRINISRQGKGLKGGFAIGGFDPNKGEPTYYLNMTPANYFIGENSGSKNVGGMYNSFMGYEAGRDNTEGISNVFLGYSAGLKNTIGGFNLFVGNSSGYNNLSGERNIFLGYNSGKSNTGGVQNWMGSDNIFIGSSSGINNTKGGSNIFIGTMAGLKNDEGSLNIYIGNRSGINSKGVRNTFLGNLTGESDSIGNDNIFIGNQAGEYSTTGEKNIFLGGTAGWKNEEGNENTFIGNSSGINIASGNKNVFVGFGSGVYSSSGDRNTYIGYLAGAYASNNGNIFIGYQAGMNETNGDKLYIENSENNSNNALIYGEFDIDFLKLNATVKIRDLLKLQPRATAPETAEEGDVYYDSGDHMLKVWNGSDWKNCWEPEP
jgi:hypothetical protein